MTAGDHLQTFLHMCSDGAGTRVRAIGASDAEVSWSATARPGEIDSRLLELVEGLDGERILSWDCRLL
ncbi:MAG: hypothetical protein ACP5KN_14565, partial [Armatimonadota bacterium]